MEQTFTVLEQKVIDAMRELLKQGDYIFFYDLNTEIPDVPYKSIKGAVGSLVKKGILFVDRDEKDLISLLID